MKRDDSSKKEKIISCAECRRLKLKCDRQFPCSSCRRRGLSALCPESSLITRPRKSPQLSKKGTTLVAKMSERIKQLEEALGTLQSKYSAEPHPLLVNNDLSDAEDQLVGELENSLGTLAIDPESGTTSFYGHSAGMESYYHHELSDLPKRALREDGQPIGAVDVIKDSVLYPLFLNVPENSIREHLDCYLPDHREARRLRNIYYESAAWLYSSIPQKVVEETVFAPVYKNPAPSLVACSLPLVTAAMMFMSFAIASCLDLHNPSADNGMIFQNSARYYQLARAALSGERSMLENPNLPTIRVLMLMVFYHMLLDEDNTPEIVWSLLSLAASMAVNTVAIEDGTFLNQSLMKDDQCFGKLSCSTHFLVGSVAAECIGIPLTPLLLGLSFGKPPALLRHFIDSEINPDEPIQLPDGRTKHGDRYRIELMSSSILPEVAEFVLSSSKHKYSEVLLMDRKLRDCADDVFGSPVGSLQVTMDDLKQLTTGGVMRNFYILSAKETLSLYLHRNHFVRVCSIPENDYFRKSRYSPSFFAALRSAQTLIKLLGFLLELEPELPCRFWHFWAHALASAIIVSSVVIHHPRCILAPEAMASTEAIYSQLCQWAAHDSHYDRPKRVLKTVGQLREKARRALETGVGGGKDLSDPADKRGIDLGLSLLAGSARVIRSSSSKLSGGSSAVSPYTPASTDSPASAPAGELHPALLEDMNSVFERVFDYALYPGGGNGNPMPLQTQTSTTAGAQTDALGGLSEQSPFQQMFPGSGYESMDTMGSHMYQDQISNQVTELTADLQQPQQQPTPSLEMLTAYGYPTMQQTSWPGMVRSQVYQTEENYPDDGAWQGLVADLGITTQ